MVCRFCAQWNPEGELRCCFCNNRLDSGDDRTASGVPDYLRNTAGGAGGVSLPATAAGGSGLGAGDDGLNPVKTLFEDLVNEYGRERVVQVTVAVAVGLLLLLGGVCVLG